MTEYPSFEPKKTERETNLQTMLDIAMLIDFSSRTENPYEEQDFLYLSNPHGNIPNVDPLTEENGEIIINVCRPDYIDTWHQVDKDEKQILLGCPRVSYSATNSPEIQSGLIQSGIQAITRGRTVCGVEGVYTDFVTVYEKPIPDLSKDKEREIADLYEKRGKEPSPLDGQLLHNPYLQKLYPRRTLAMQEGFVPLGKIDLVGLSGTVKDFFGRQANTQGIRLPRLGGLYSYYRLLQAGFDTRIVENPSPFTNYPPDPNAFAVMARPQAASL